MICKQTTHFTPDKYNSLLQWPINMTYTTVVEDISQRVSSYAGQWAALQSYFGWKMKTNQILVLKHSTHEVSADYLLQTLQCFNFRFDHQIHFVAKYVDIS